jgi:hypothetical protein
MHVAWGVMERWGFAAHCACEARLDYAGGNQKHMINKKFSETLMRLKRDILEWLQKNLKKINQVSR